ncbi:unnamed protein product [Closterium sp. NIES-64]|nr:unnamed protein product [Closterium sp. NIES-64]
MTARRRGNPETHGGGEGGDDDDEDHEMDGLEPEGREEEVGEGGGRAATEAGSQHVREGGGSVGVKVGGRKAVTIREPRQRKKAKQVEGAGVSCTFTGEPLGEGCDRSRGRRFPVGATRECRMATYISGHMPRLGLQLAKEKGMAIGGGHGSGGMERWMTTKTDLGAATAGDHKAGGHLRPPLPHRRGRGSTHPARPQLRAEELHPLALDGFPATQWSMRLPLFSPAIAEMLTKEGELGCRVSFTIDMWTSPNNRAWLVTTPPATLPAFRWMSEEGGGQCFFSSRMHLRCLAHVINLAVKAALAVTANPQVAEDSERDGVVDRLLAAALRKFLGLQRTLNAQGNPAKPKPALKLVQDSPTRWGSTHDMVECVSKADKAKMDTLRLTDADSETLHSVKTFLSPFAKVSKAAEGAAYPTVAMVLPYYNGLIDAMESRLAKGPLATLKPMIEAALGLLKKYELMSSNELWIATFLDPSMKAAWFDDRALGDAASRYRPEGEASSLVRRDAEAHGPGLSCHPCHVRVEAEARVLPRPQPHFLEAAPPSLSEDASFHDSQIMVHLTPWTEDRRGPPCKRRGNHQSSPLKARGRRRTTSGREEEGEEEQEGVGAGDTSDAEHAVVGSSSGVQA